MSPKTAFVVIATVAISLPGAARADDSGAEKFKSDAEKFSLIEKAVARLNTVNRWLIEYEAVAVTKNTASFPVHKVMAVSAPGDFYHLSAHFSSSNPWQVDPFCQEFFIHHGSTWHRWPLKRTYSEGTIKAGDYFPGTIRMDVLLLIIRNYSGHGG